jgi:hypothetical protein
MSTVYGTAEEMVDHAFQHSKAMGKFVHLVLPVEPEAEQVRTALRARGLKEATGPNAPPGAFVGMVDGKRVGVVVVVNAGAEA